jgi:hypothetical protein
MHDARVNRLNGAVISVDQDQGRLLWRGAAWKQGDALKQKHLYWSIRYEYINQNFRCDAAGDCRAVARHPCRRGADIDSARLAERGGAVG